MTLYVHDKRGNRYKPLSLTKIKKLRRVDEVNELCAVLSQATPTIRALTAWLEQVGKRGNKMTHSDLVVCRLPNVERVNQLINAVEEATIRVNAV